MRLRRDVLDAGRAGPDLAAQDRVVEVRQGERTAGLRVHDLVAETEAGQDVDELRGSGVQQLPELRLGDVRDVVAARVLLHLVRHRLVEVDAPGVRRRVHAERARHLLELHVRVARRREAPERVERLVPGRSHVRHGRIPDVRQASGRQVDDVVRVDAHGAAVRVLHLEHAGPA